MWQGWGGVGGVMEMFGGRRMEQGRGLRAEMTLRSRGSMSSPGPVYTSSRRGSPACALRFCRLILRQDSELALLYTSSHTLARSGLSCHSASKGRGLGGKGSDINGYNTRVSLYRMCADTHSYFFGFIVSTRQH